MKGRDDAALVTVFFGSLRHAQAVRTATGLRAPVLMDRPVRRAGQEQATTLQQRYGIEQVPMTLVVNAEGRAVELISGAYDRERFIKALNDIN